MKKPINFAIIACMLGACATKQQSSTMHSPPPPERSAGSLDNVRFGEVVKGYPISRYRDPADPRIMHERHVVYRVEADPSFRLNANRNQQIIVGNLVTDRRSGRKPITSQELTSEVLHARAQNTLIAEQQRSIAIGMGSTQRALQSIAGSTEFLARKLAETQADVRLLKEKNVQKRENVVGSGSGEPVSPPEPTSATQNGELR